MAKQLAKNINKPLLFVKTPWTDLTTFLKQGKCDIAMGGITKTPKRQELFYTSLPVLYGHKGAIFSSNNAPRFSSFQSINQRGITVIENTGGTNAHYAKRIITKANLVIVKKNADAFSCLTQYPNKPLVMITDNIEVNFRAKQSGEKLSTSGLAITLPSNPKTEKFYLLPKTQAGKILLQQVNKLIKNLRNSHHLQLLYQQALSSKYDLASGYCPLTIKPGKNG